MQGSGAIDKFVCDQLSQWPLACENFRALKGVKTKTLRVGGLDVIAQFNPARIISSAANTDADALKKRPCFLCRENRPHEQMSMLFEGRKGKKYDMLVNPYPIFPSHLVIANSRHSDQTIWQRFVDMLDLSKAYKGYTFFYNGPKCGASAPDHHHFQATGCGQMPLETEIDRLLDRLKEAYDQAPDMRTIAAGIDDKLGYVASIQDAHLYHYKRYARGVFVLKARSVKSSARLFYRLLDCAPLKDGDSEPRINLYTFFKDGEFRTIIIFRQCHRSHHYFSEGTDHLTMSPGCADMCGVFIVPKADEFEKLDEKLLEEMISEVTLSEDEEERLLWKLTRSQMSLSVGILSGESIDFEMIADGAGVQRASYREGKVDYNGTLYDELYFEATTPSTMFAEPTFILHGVTIGKEFHWERKESQKFAGALRIIVDGKKLTAINHIGVEDYLLSVISSEMKATSSPELLKAHAVISRSWVIAQIEARSRKRHADCPKDLQSTAALVTYLDSTLMGRKKESSDDDGTVRICKWYDHDDHRLFDVCADDHCQRYQGLSRAIGENVKKAIDETWGQVLEHDGKICDARFSKCCGGSSELFSTCWEDEDKPYLQALPDTPGHDPKAQPFCDSSDKEILREILNDYDTETTDFYRWRVEYGLDTLSELLMRRSGVNTGRIESMEALERGPSGRIKSLLVRGSQKSLQLGKELEIRKLLSESHLKSSAFEARMEGDKIVLEGKGWGHGVGLCQIGAAVMASRGYGYKEILEHYYPGATIGKR